jgi:hypothetical protein
MIITLFSLILLVFKGKDGAAIYLLKSIKKW